MNNPVNGGPYVIYTKEDLDLFEVGPMFSTVDSARQCVINNLDLSLNPEIVRCGSSRYFEIKKGNQLIEKNGATK